jgi:hypothetical protein
MTKLETFMYMFIALCITALFMYWADSCKSYHIESDKVELKRDKDMSTLVEVPGKCYYRKVN